MKTKPKSKDRESSHGTELTAIISNEPHWIVRSFSYIITAAVVIILAITYFIEYPQVIHSKLRIAAIDAPKPVMAPTPGTITKLFVADGSIIKKGTSIALIKNTGDHGAIQQLDDWADSNIANYFRQPLPVVNDIGEFSNTYAELLTLIKNYEAKRTTDYYNKQVKKIEQDLNVLNKINKIQGAQKQHAYEDYLLQVKQFEAQQELAQDKVISQSELNLEKSKLLGKQQAINVYDNSKENIQLSILNKQTELRDALLKKDEDENQILESILKLKRGIAEWKMKHTIIAPCDGRLIYAQSVQENQYAIADSYLFYIVPSTSSYYGEMTPPQAGMGKIRPGQTVRIKIEGYPSQEYGFIEGKISYIPNLIRNDSIYLVKVQLPHRLKTNMNKYITYNNNMNASAEIIVDNERLFTRVFKSLLKRN